MLVRVFTFYETTAPRLALLKSYSFTSFLTECSIAGSMVTRMLLLFGEKSFREWYMVESGPFEAIFVYFSDLEL